MTSSSAVDKGTHAAVGQLVVAAAAGVAAWAAAPELGSATQHAAFADFFATCAQVIAALLIALAIEAQVAARKVHLAVVTVASVAVGEVAAIAALSPSLPSCSYRWLFAATVGGGFGALVAVLVASARLLVARIDQGRREELDKLGEIRDAIEQQRR